MNDKDQVLSRKAVAVVFDPDFGSRIEAIMKEMSVWIAESQSNTKAVDKARECFHEFVEITVFFCRPDESKKDYFARVLYAVDEHEGKTSKLDGYDELLIYGASQDEVGIHILNELGLENIEKTAFGCRASRR